MLALHELQARFFAALTGPAGGARSSAIEAAITPTATLGTAARLGIYRTMYRARLLEVLEEDFPATARVLDPLRFAAVGRRYVARHTSTHPSLRLFGARFPEFLVTARSAHARPYVADLARLEWTRLAVFDAPDPDPLPAAALQAVPPDRWGGLCFRLIAAAAILESAWPIHEVWRRAAPAEIGTETAFDRDVTIETRPTTLRVWREGYTVFQASMEATERDALALIAAGRPLADVCERLAEEMPADDAARRAGELLARWIEDAILERP